MQMQERIDALIKMRKEKPEHKWEWEKLCNALLHETNLLTPEQTHYLNTSFKEITQSELLKVWDDRFHEVLITGTFTDEYSIAMDNSATGRVTLGGNVGTASWTTAAAISTNAVRQTLTDEMVKAYAQYKDKPKKTK